VHGELHANVCNPGASRTRRRAHEYIHCRDIVVPAVFPGGAISSSPLVIVQAVGQHQQDKKEQKEAVWQHHSSTALLLLLLDCCICAPVLVTGGVAGGGDGWRCYEGWSLLLRDCL
jgi:hypothetical protein